MYRWYAQADETITEGLSENPRRAVAAYCTIPTGFLVQKIGPLVLLADNDGKVSGII
jgi:hypothetical protein